MRKSKLFTMILLLFSSLLFGTDKKVLVEIFTNSHCALCPAAHSALDSYLQTSNGNKIVYIYYHMSFPYSTDQIHLNNVADATSKNDYYGPYFSTPQAFFKGEHVSNSYSSWSSRLDNLVSEQSNYELILSGNFTDNDFTINAEITKTIDSQESQLTINYVVVEDVNYTGSNGISDHKNVMRKIVNTQGDSFTINLNETKNLQTTISKNTEWNPDKLKIVVFIQSSATKEVFQAESINYNELVLTNVYNNEIVPNEFKLEQNYPNPFNPITTIKYSIPNLASDLSSSVILTIYDILGNKISTLVDEIKAPGNYEVLFEGSELSSGVYYYQLNAGDPSTSSGQGFIKTKRMILLK